MSKLSRALLNAVLPEDCRLCGERLTNFSRIPVCDACLARPEAFTPEFYCASCRTPFVNRFPLDESGRCAMCRMQADTYDEAYAFGSYEGRLRELIHLYKYSGVDTLARPFGEWLAVALPLEKRFDAVIPMPLHWRKRFERGFNQADFLAEEIARRWHVPRRAVLRRTRATAPQAGLTNSKRRLNVRRAFAVKRGTRLDGLRVLLVDDVLTTGSTATACARALKRAGAKHVTVLTLARTDRRLRAAEWPEKVSSAAAAAGSSSV